jgi:hypothetical protein
LTAFHNPHTREWRSGKSLRDWLREIADRHLIFTTRTYSRMEYYRNANDPKLSRANNKAPGAETKPTTFRTPLHESESGFGFLQEDGTSRTFKWAGQANQGEIQR